MRRKCVIIGGGLAGLSAGVCLAKAGVEVEVFESSPKPGGRAYSFREPSMDDVIDNGQHIMMGCYTETLRFLQTIGATNKLLFQESLQVDFVDKKLGMTPLKTGKSFYPFNLLKGLLSYKALKFSERLEIIGLFSKLPFLRDYSLAGMTILEWLRKEGQSTATIKAFWEILSVGALNTDPARASASLFASILKKMFLHGNSASTIILPKVGLSELFCESAIKFISSNGGSIRLSEPVKEVEIIDGAAKKILLGKRQLSDFDFVISAVPYYSFTRIFPDAFVKSLELENMPYSSIISLNIWLKENPFKGRFYGLVDSPVHWVFNHGKFITTVISNADEISGRSKDDLQELIIGELEEYFPQFQRGFICGVKLIKEKRATFVPLPHVLSRRPDTVSKVKNLFLAGDWTQTGLPATIEGAVQSGHNAARAGINYLKNTPGI
ncbi:MAG: NAD(P)-binding protein [Ignavibacteria bacterium]|jgi:squalene-associated FAD-dependent desaturase|nr:NAD(P)-binding protein [Ignavibacteria bacterium]